METLFFLPQPAFTRISKRLKKILADFGVSTPKNFNFKEVSASVLGFGGHQEILNCRKQRKLPHSSFDARTDEELTSTELTARRVEQARVLQHIFCKFQINVLAQGIVDQWRPTSQRPKWETLTSDILERYSGNQYFHGLKSLLRRQIVRTPIELREIFNEIRAIYKANKADCKLDLAKELEAYAWSLYQGGGEDNLSFGIEILELLVEDDDYLPAIFTLSELLHKQAKTPAEYNRVYTLLVKIKEMLNGGIDVFGGSKEVLRYCIISGRTLLDTNDATFRKHGFSCLELGSKLGSSKCSATLSRIHGCFNINLDPEQVRYERAPRREKKWEYYSDLAIMQGWDPVTDSHPEV